MDVVLQYYVFLYMLHGNLASQREYILLQHVAVFNVNSTYRTKKKTRFICYSIFLLLNVDNIDLVEKSRSADGTD